MSIDIVLKLQRISVASSICEGHAVSVQVRHRNTSHWFEGAAVDGWVASWAETAVFECTSTKLPPIEEALRIYLYIENQEVGSCQCFVREWESTTFVCDLEYSEGSSPTQPKCEISLSVNMTLKSFPESQIKKDKHSLAEFSSSGHRPVVPIEHVEPVRVAPPVPMGYDLEVVLDPDDVVAQKRLAAIADQVAFQEGEFRKKLLKQERKIRRAMTDLSFTLLKSRPGVAPDGSWSSWNNSIVQSLLALYVNKSNPHVDQQEFMDTVRKEMHRHFNSEIPFDKRAPKANSARRNIPNWLPPLQESARKSTHMDNIRVIDPVPYSALPAHAPQPALRNVPYQADGRGGGSPRGDYMGSPSPEYSPDGGVPRFSIMDAYRAEREAQAAHERRLNELDEQLQRRRAGHRTLAYAS